MHMVDSTIASINASSTPLGYIGMSISSTSTSAAMYISMISTSTTYVGGTGSLGGTSGGGSAFSLPRPPSLANPVLNTILQSMGQL